MLPALWTSADYAPSVQLKDQSIARSRGGCSEAAAATVPTWAIGGGKGPAATAGGRLEPKLELQNS